MSVGEYSVMGLSSTGGWKVLPKVEPLNSEQPAFANPKMIGYMGLTKRELFAAIAMHSINGNLGANALKIDERVQAAVAHADSLLEELAKPLAATTPDMKGATPSP